jgi:hypothetical protein
MKRSDKVLQILRCLREAEDCYNHHKAASQFHLASNWAGIYGKLNKDLYKLIEVTK